MSDSAAPPAKKAGGLAGLIGLKVGAARAKNRVVQRREAQGKTDERGSGVPGQPMQLGGPKIVRSGSMGGYMNKMFKLVGLSKKSGCADHLRATLSPPGNFSATLCELLRSLRSLRSLR